MFKLPDPDGDVDAGGLLAVDTYPDGAGDKLLFMKWLLVESKFPYGRNDDDELAPSLYMFLVPTEFSFNNLL